MAEVRRYFLWNALLRRYGSSWHVASDYCAALSYGDKQDTGTEGVSRIQGLNVFEECFCNGILDGIDGRHTSKPLWNPSLKRVSHRLEGNLKKETTS